MARRRLLSDEQLAPFWAWASDERAIVRQYTLSRADLDLTPGFLVQSAPKSRRVVDRVGA